MGRWKGVERQIKNDKSRCRSFEGQWRGAKRLHRGVKYRWGGLNLFTTTHDGNFRRHLSMHGTIHDANFRQIYNICTSTTESWHALQSGSESVKGQWRGVQCKEEALKGDRQAFNCNKEA